MKRFLICMTVVFVALAFVNCKTGGEGSSALPGASGKSGLFGLFGKGKCNDDLGDIDTTYAGFTAEDPNTWLTRNVADHRIKYGTDPLNFADLRLPKDDRLKSADGYPVMVVIHGGGWNSTRSLDWIGGVAEALTDFGIATWNLEFRRIGNPGGAYPGEFQDVGKAVDHLRVLAPEYNLDMSRVGLIGHSSGGHLVLWAASRHKIDPSSPLYVADPLPIKGVVNLAGIPNLEDAYLEGNRTDTFDLLNLNSADPTGSYTLAQPLYPSTSPYHMLPIGVRTSSIIGDLDNAWRIGITQQYHDAAIAGGDDAKWTLMPGMSHWDTPDICGPGWPTMVQEVHWVLDAPPPTGDLNKSRFCPQNGRVPAP